MGADNEKYASNARRIEAEEEIMGAIGEWCGRHTMEEVMAAMRAARVPSGPIMSAADIAGSEQYRERGMLQEAPVPGHDYSLSVPAILPVLSETPGRTITAGADLGFHTREVLREELGMSDAEMDALADKGVI